MGCLSQMKNKIGIVGVLVALICLLLATLKIGNGFNGVASLGFLGSIIGAVSCFTQFILNRKVNKLEG